MTRNQLLPDILKKFSDSVMFTVDGSGKISPTDEQSVNRGGAILTQHDPTCLTQFSGLVCAQQNNVCQCSALVGVSSGSHMTIGQPYTINMSVSVGSDYELYSVDSSGAVANTTNGHIHIGG